MVSTLAYGKQKNELNMIVKLEREIAAYVGDERWQCELFLRLEQVRDFLADHPLIDIMCYEVEADESLTYLEKIRKDYRQTYLLLLADTGLSPMTYLRPGIMANALLLRPWSAGQAKKVLEELIGAFMETRSEPASDDFFVIEGRDGRINIPFDKIFYFEAREKKIFACTGKEEFGFYHTMEELQKELPEQFIRCHRGFIVNRKKIRKIMISKNLIMLAEGFEVPLSRSYKAELKRLGK